MDDADIVGNWDDLWVQARNTFVEVFEKKPEPTRRKSAPPLLETHGRRSRSLEIGSLLSTLHQAPFSTEQEVSLEDCTLEHEASMGETRDADLQLSLDITQVPDRAHSEQALTYMVCDLPCKIGEERMMDQLKSMGFDGCYDYLYFPKRKRSWQYGEGYCFINFMSVEVALRFKTFFQGHRFSGINSLKQARVEVADVQGLEANIRLFTNRKERPKYISDINGIRLGSHRTSIEESNVKLQVDK
eukprot:TRINITY_DN9584_c0_g3_i1.p1 TRINITY_DN9584_c0_g3~~TRINITY_DN9584_c0_g3_i1.p1  ORF type:complete len:244 (-),score=32.63 TRINITY_DN9584_c0_g3_i1:228-959(-)